MLADFSSLQNNYCNSNYNTTTTTAMSDTEQPPQRRAEEQEGPHNDHRKDSSFPSSNQRDNNHHNSNNRNNNRDRRERGNSRDKKRNHQNSNKRPFAIETEDPRVLEGGPEKKIKLAKQNGQGRNTESFDPRSTLVRPDMRILMGSKDDLQAIKEGRIKLKHDDVLVVPNFFCEKDDWSIYNTLIHEMRDSMKQGVQRSEWIR